MATLTRNEIKDHLRIEHANSTHDDLIDRLNASAQAWACSFLQVDSLDVFDTDSSPPSSPFRPPEDLKTGLLFHIEAAFARDERLMTMLFERAEWLVYPYRRQLGV